MTRSWHSSEQRAQPARQEREAVWTPASGAEGRAAVVSTAPGAGAGVGARWGWPRISPPGSSRLRPSHPALTSGCPGTRESRVGSVLPGCDCSEGPGHLRGRLGWRINSELNKLWMVYNSLERFLSVGFRTIRGKPTVSRDPQHVSASPLLGDICL